MYPIFCLIFFVLFNLPAVLRGGAIIYLTRQQIDITVTIHTYLYIYNIQMRIFKLVMAEG